MRFRMLGPYSRGKTRVETQAEEQQDAEQQTTRDPSLPLEWRSLASFVEAHREQKPRKEYLDSFWRRLWPRLERATRQDQLVREYLAQTFWRRWVARAAVALVVAALALAVYSQRKHGEQLEQRVAGLEERIRMQEAGM